MLDGKPQIATKEHCNAPWSGNKRNFRCGLCGYQFKVGDYWRFVYTNSIPGYGGNPLVCNKCDGPDVIEKWKALCDEWRKIWKSDKFWYFIRHYTNNGKGE